MKSLFASGALLFIAFIFLLLCIGGMGIPYMATMWGGLFDKVIHISWWLGAGIQLAMGIFIWRNSTWLILGLVIITWFCELGGVFA